MHLYGAYIPHYSGATTVTPKKPEDDGLPLQGTSILPAKLPEPQKFDLLRIIPEKKQQD